MPGEKSRTVNRVARGVLQRLESLQRAGVTHLPSPPVLPKSTARTVAAAAVAGPAEAASSVSKLKINTPLPPRPAVPKPAGPLPVAPSSSKPLAEVPPAERAAALAVIQAKVAKCVRCAELARTRNKTVFGSGDPNARLVFMGEAPGADEDQQGLPFVGAAGQKLTKMIETMGLQRPDVYILNTIKCRPPGNRVPLPDEAANCREYLDRQLEILRPEVICCLGATAAQNLLGTTLAIGKMRGQMYEHGGAKVICTYHPAYLLRNPSANLQIWQDLKVVLRILGLPVPKYAWDKQQDE